MHYLVLRTEPKRFFLFFRVTYHTGRDQRLPLSFFSALRDFFFEKNFPQRVSPAFFLMFCDRMDVEKSQRVPPFSFFSALWDFFPKMKIFVFFNFFMFCDRMDVEKPQRVPLSVFRHCETLARQGLALASPGVPLGPFFWVCNFFKIFFPKIFDFWVL